MLFSEGTLSSFKSAEKLLPTEGLACFKNNNNNNLNSRIPFKPTPRIPFQHFRLAFPVAAYAMREVVCWQCVPHMKRRLNRTLAGPASLTFQGRGLCWASVSTAKETMLEQAHASIDH